jgi:PKD repeat protein
MFKLIDASVPAIQPPFEIQSATSANAGETMALKAAPSSPDAPVLSCHWDFGDGTALDGMEVHHAYTHSGDYDVHVTVTGLDAITNSKNLRISISGDISTRFVPAEKQRPE